MQSKFSDQKKNRIEKLKEIQTLNLLEALPEGESLSQNEDCRREVSRFRDLPRLSMTASKNSKRKNGKITSLIWNRKTGNRDILFK